MENTHMGVIDKSNDTNIHMHKHIHRGILTKYMYNSKIKKKLKNKKLKGCNKITRKIVCENTKLRDKLQVNQRSWEVKHVSFIIYVDVCF